MRFTQIAALVLVSGGASWAVVGCSAGGAPESEPGSDPQLASLTQAVSSQLQADCATQCATSQQLGCGETQAECTAECLNLGPIRPSCKERYGDLIECAAGLDPSGFVCFEGVAFITGCSAEAAVLSECQGGPSPQGLNGLCRAQCDRLTELSCALPVEQCYEECTFFSAVGAPCGREFQALTICTTQAAPEGWSCDFPEIGPVSFFICEEEQADLTQCFENL
jgi:hypothetical protein